MGIKDCLIAARELISDPHHWTRDVEARNNKGTACDPRSKTATRFCAIGALRHVCHDVGERFAAVDLLDNIAGKINGMHIATVNDKKGRKAVINIYDKAISECE